MASDDRDDVTSPYSGEVVGQVAVATVAHADAAVDAAVRALADPRPSTSAPRSWSAPGRWCSNVNKR